MKGNADTVVTQDVKNALIDVQHGTVLESLVRDLYVEAVCDLARNPLQQTRELARITRAIEAEPREYAQKFLLELKTKLVRAFEERRTRNGVDLNAERAGQFAAQPSTINDPYSKDQTT